MKQPKIEKGIPIPRKWQTDKKTTILDNMEVGDSIFISVETKDFQKSVVSIRSNAGQTAKKKGWKIVSRLYRDENGLRIWRTE